MNYTHAPVLALTHILSPSTILEVSARVTRWVEDGAALNQSDLTRLNRKNAGVNIPQFYPQNNPDNIVPVASFGGVSNAPTTSLNARFPLRGAETPLFSDATLTNTHGPHVFKLGSTSSAGRRSKENPAIGPEPSISASNSPNDSNHPFAKCPAGYFQELHGIQYLPASVRIHQVIRMVRPRIIGKRLAG